VLKRFPDGAAAAPFFQKRVPDTAPDWLQTATISFPSGRTARELLPNDAAHLVWGLNLGVIDWNPWPVRAPDLDQPDELRVDLDPTPEASWDDVRQVALCAGEVLRDFDLTGFPKTSGSRGIHINVRIKPEHDFPTVRRAALALARVVERRVPELATTRWWKEERHGVFIDYNQNARDRTVASAYSQHPCAGRRSRTWSPATCGSQRSPKGSPSGATRALRSTPTSARSTSCWSRSSMMRRVVSATRRGRRTSPSSPASPSACNPAVPDGRTESDARVHRGYRREPD
jgi:DNA ligase D-like protein (predicted polymerase)